MEELSLGLWFDHDHQQGQSWSYRCQAPGHAHVCAVLRGCLVGISDHDIHPRVVDQAESSDPATAVRAGIESSALGNPLQSSFPFLLLLVPSSVRGDLLANSEPGFCCYA